MFIIDESSFNADLHLAITGVLLFLVLESKNVGASIKKSITWVETAMRTRVWVV